MDYPPIPEDEAGRLAALRRYDVLDTPADATFDRIAEAAAALFDSPTAITNLVAELRGHFTAVHGGERGGADRADMICSSVIMQDDVVVYEDARTHPYTSQIPGVNAMGVVFYAAAPLHTHDGYNLGTLCVLDNRPRTVTERQKQLLAGLAAVVIDEMELRLAARRLVEAEAAMRRLNHELEAANRNKSEFLARMSHELRTPLNAILGASELLGDGLFGALNERQAEYVGDIHRSGQHLLSLINDVLDLAKVESGRVEPDLSPVRLSSLMESCAAIVRGVASRKQIALSVAVPPQDLTFEADERMMKQILYNLLSNAVKFTPEDGSVRFSARAGAREVTFTVEDNGPGVPREHREDIFEEFVQLPGEQEGTGLGLAVVKRLVELHGGGVRVDASDAGGSAFSFTIPLRAAP